jgi:putative transcriptional regulator
LQNKYLQRIVEKGIDSQQMVGYNKDKDTTKGCLKVVNWLEDILKRKRRDILIMLRNKRNLKQKDVAKAVGVTTSYYGMIELGERNPCLELAGKIANFFGTKVENIFFEDLNNKTLVNDASQDLKESA